MIISTFKKYLTIVVLVVITSNLVACKKSIFSDKTCYDCTVYRRDGSTYKEKVCTDTGFAPQFTDGLGNDLNCYCTKR